MIEEIEDTFHKQSVSYEDQEDIKVDPKIEIKLWKWCINTWNMRLNYKSLIDIKRGLTNRSAHSLKSDRNGLCAEFWPVKLCTDLYPPSELNKTA